MKRYTQSPAEAVFSRRLAGFAAGCLFAFWGFCACAAREIPVSVKDAVMVETVRAEFKPYGETVSSFGSLSYKTKNDVTALVGGTIRELRVREGSAVKKGQTLAVLRNIQFEFQLEQAKNALEGAKSALGSALVKKWETELGVESRLLSLSKSAITIAQKELELKNAQDNLRIKQDLLAMGGITEAAFRDLCLGLDSLEAQLAVLKKERSMSQLGLREQDLVQAGFTPAADEDEKRRQFIKLNTRGAEAEIENARAALRNAEKNVRSVEKLIEELTLVTPVSGIVGARYFEAGEYVRENDKVYTIIDTATVAAIFPVQEQDIGFFRNGTPVTVSVPSLSRDFNTTVCEVSPMADSESGNFIVRSDITNPDAVLKPGMFAGCTLVRGEKSAAAVLPESVLSQTNGGGSAVFTVVNGMLACKSVRIANRKDGYLWITAGIGADDEVVLKPSPFFREGQRVRR